MAGSEEFFSAMRESLSCTCVILTVGKSQVALRSVHICRQDGSSQRNVCLGVTNRTAFCNDTGKRRPF